MLNAKAEHYKQWFKLGINSEIGIGNFFEYIIQLIYSSILSTGDIAIDGGANRGLHSLPMARIVGVNGMVIGFEAIPKLANDLTSKLVECGIKNVIIRPVAIGDIQGQINFHYVPDCDYRSGIKEREGIPDSAKNSAINISVPLSTLDDEMDQERKVRFIKLDLEGGEYHALRGANRIMNESKPLIVFENDRETAAQVYNYSRSDWFSLFENSHYEVYDIFGRRFAIEDWDKTDWEKSCVPWYFIAACRECDKAFVEKKLPHLIGTLSMVINRHCSRK